MWQATSADIVVVDGDVAGDPDGDVGRFVPDRFSPQPPPDDWARGRSQETFRNYYALPAVE